MGYNWDMDATDPLLPPIARLLDRVVSDPHARDTAKLELLGLQNAPEMNALRAQLCAIVAEAQSADPWTSRARPTFLYVMYVLLLWSIPMGLIAAFRPETAAAIVRGMELYLNGIPEPLYALFGTGYVGYTVAREWGKGKK